MRSWTTVLAVDFSEPECAAHRLNFPDTPVLCAKVEDVLDRVPSGVGVVHGGPPCQGFSLAGEGLGEDDERNGFPAFIEAVSRSKPRHFLAENVKGLLTQKHWPYFAGVVRDLERIGYAVEWRLLDAVSFGVPQFRERVWAWGIRSDLDRDGMRHVWPVPTHAWPPPEPCMFGRQLLPGVTVGQALNLDGWLVPDRGVGMCERYGDRREIPTTEPSPVLAAGSKGSGPRYSIKTHRGPEWAKLEAERTIDEPSPAVTAGSRAGGHDGLYMQVVGGGCDLEFQILDRQNGALHPATEPSGTIRAGEGKGGHFIVAPAAFGPGPWKLRNGMWTRRLSVLECTRLQSVPDSYRWPEKFAKTSAYRVIGNGMACEMARHLGEAIRAVDPECDTAVSLFCGAGLGDLGFEGRSWRYEPAREAVSA